MVYDCHPSFANGELGLWGWRNHPEAHEQYKGQLGPHPQPGLTCLSPEPTLWNERTKKSKMFPRPATVGSEFQGLSVSFCFFLALYQTSPKCQESLSYHLLSPNHMRHMAVSFLNDVAWKQPYPVRTCLSFMREKEPTADVCLQAEFQDHKGGKG